MTENGTVQKIKGNYVEVRIGRNSACASCGKCGMTESQKHVDFFVENTCNAVVGDTVELDIPEANAAKLALVAYILPLVPAIALIMVSFFLHWPVWASIVSFVGGFAVGLAILVAIDRTRKYKWANSPTMVRIVAPNIKEIETKETENE